MNLLWFPLLFGLFASVSAFHNIKEFCKSSMLQAISDETNSYIESTRTCTATLDFDVDIRSANEICSYYSPFPTYEVRNLEDGTLSCKWKPRQECQSASDDFIVNTCVLFTDKLPYANYTCPDNYKKLKVTNSHIARWITSAKLGKSDGVWIDSPDKSPQYIAMKPILGKGIQIGSIQPGHKDMKFIGACSAKNLNQVDDTNNSKKFFYTKNLYQPRKLGRSSKGEDILKDMDAVCKKIHPNSMLAPVYEDAIKKNVYIGVQASRTFKTRDASTKCGKGDRYSEEFDIVAHYSGYTTETRFSGAGGQFFKQCADSFAMAVITSDNQISNVPAFARRRIACLTKEGALRKNGDGTLVQSLQLKVPTTTTTTTTTRAPPRPPPPAPVVLPPPSGPISPPRPIAPSGPPRDPFTSSAYGAVFCPRGWKMSDRADRFPMCYKVMAWTWGDSHSYKESRKVCHTYDAELAVLEHQEDHNAAFDSFNGNNNAHFCAYVAAQNLNVNSKAPVSKNDFSWLFYRVGDKETDDDMKTVKRTGFAERKPYKWSIYDPSRNEPSIACPVRERCLIWCDAGLIDIKCDCKAELWYSYYHAGHVACMKSAWT